MAGGYDAWKADWDSSAEAEAEREAERRHGRGRCPDCDMPRWLCRETGGCQPDEPDHD